MLLRKCYVFKCVKIKNKLNLVATILLVGVLVCIAEANAAITVARAFYGLASQNNTQKIEALIRRGYSLESVDESGYNPVCIAVARQDRKAYKTLVSYGAKKHPTCLQRVPETSYKRFFGTRPIKDAIKTYEADTPYLMGTALLGGGAILTAYALKGSTGSGGGDSSGGGENDNDDNDDKDNAECPANSTYNEDTKKCDCNPGYGHFGDEKKCYAKIDNCIIQNKDVCKTCDDEYKEEKGVCVFAANCPANSTYNSRTKKCDCDLGYGHFGDENACYKQVSYCSNQIKDKCLECIPNYHLKDNVCYGPIYQCKEQVGNICLACNEGYGIFDGDGTKCYQKIENCDSQTEDRCNNCKAGYGTHGDPKSCYKDVENCISYNPANREMCSECRTGYETYGDGLCYDPDFCKDYPNSVPANGVCVCDLSRGYTGDPYNGTCSQAVDGEYSEGDGNRDEWSNLNDIHCNSHGQYQSQTGLCLCYEGYAGSDCSSCNEEIDADGDARYLEFGGKCYKNKKCDISQNLVQNFDKCVCASGFITIDGVCTEAVDCGLGMVQTKVGTNPDEVCQCKNNFVEDVGGGCICPTKENGFPDSIFEYDPANDECIMARHDCTEKNINGDKWTGENCDECPSQYAITIDETGPRCGLQCAENRANIELNPECTDCADGYDYNEHSGTCVKLTCMEGGSIIKGYIIVDGRCQCDEENGYALNVLGVCELKKEPLIGLSDTNINNNIITVENNGEFRDVYGMKPVASVDQEGNETYYEAVYNSLNYENAEINITNSNTGNNSIYGIYSPSVIYNASATGATGDIIAKGTINIENNKSISSVYGIYNDSDDNIYNAFSYNTSKVGSNNQATGSINITKDGKSGSTTIGIEGGRNIYNSYAGTTNGMNANSVATGNINITHEGVGTIYGIKGTSSTGKITNAFAYLDSVVSDAVSNGNITITGKSGVYGIYSNGNVVNSETQFNKNYNVVNNFSATGTINVLGASSSRGEGAYGIYVSGADNVKSEVFNAMGYNSTGDIIVKNTGGGTAYGIYSERDMYVETDEEGNRIEDAEGNPIYIYNNTYNAFRSSKAYGGDNVAAKGTIDVEITGASTSEHNAVGIYAAGDVFNAYTDSHSDVKLETIGTIKIKDASDSGNMFVKGIEAGGDKVANAYLKGENLNTSSKAIGNIILEKTGMGAITKMAGIYHGIENNSKGPTIFNAALINDKGYAEGNIELKAATKVFEMYGIYSDRATEQGTIKTIYNAYYDNSTDISEGKVRGNITVKSLATGGGKTNVYGIYAKDGIVYNAYTSNEEADVVGTISVEAIGGMQGGEVVGIYGEGANSKIYNSGYNSIINVKSTGNGLTGKADAYGMKGIKSTIANEGKINVEMTNASNKNNAVGIYVEEGVATNHIDATITVSGHNNTYGMFANVKAGNSDDAIILNDGVVNVSGDGNNFGIFANIEKNSNGKIEVENNGTINISGNSKKQNVGIYASGEGVTIKNTGTINITLDEGTDTEVTSNCVGGNCNNGTSIVLNGATFDTSGVVASSTTIDLDAMNGDVQISKGGQFITKDDIKGELSVANSTIKDTFDTTITLKDALSANNVSSLNLSSKSYMYNASLNKNEDDKYDINMKMKDFNELTSSDKADYYKLNYANKNNMELFNALKIAKNAKQFSRTESEILGEYVLGNVTEEELRVARSLDRTMMSELFKQGDDIRKFVGGDTVFIGRDDTNTLTGYELDSKTMYALYDKKLDNKYRLGLGLSFTHTNTDYNNDSSRKNFIVQGYVPLTYKISNALTAVTMARIGYEDGEYTRYGYDNKINKADTSGITYGLLNELRYTTKVAGFDITPFVGLNMIGWYQDSIKEDGRDMALSLASSHVFSLESALGLYLDKEINLSEKSKLTTSLGIGYYHEFANPYSGTKSRMIGDMGYYKIKNNVADSRDRGVISAKVNYDYKDFSIYGMLLQYLEDEYPLNVDLGLRYKF